MAKITTILFVCISLLGMSSCNSDRLAAQPVRSAKYPFEFTKTIIFYDTISTDTIVFIAKDFGKDLVFGTMNYVNPIKESDHFTIIPNRLYSPNSYQSDSNLYYIYVYLNWADRVIVKKSNQVGPLGIEIYKNGKYVTYWKRIK